MTPEELRKSDKSYDIAGAVAIGLGVTLLCSIPYLMISALGYVHRSGLSDDLFYYSAILIPVPGVTLGLMSALRSKAKRDHQALVRQIESIEATRMKKEAVRDPEK